MTTKPQLILSALALTGLWLSPGAPRAATLNWNCTSDNWATTTCWSPNGTPTGADDVSIFTVGGADTGLTIDTTTGAAVANTVTVDATAPTTVTVDQSGGSLAAGTEVIGLSGTGAFTQSGGTNTVTNALFLGGYWDWWNYTVAGSGSYDLSAGDLAAGFEYVGYYGTGAFTQTGGTNTVTNGLFLGYQSTDSGSYALSGTGILSADYEYVGIFGTGAFTQSGGTNTVASTLYLGYTSTGSGSYALSAGDLAASWEYVGYFGTGAFTQSGGTNTVASTLYLGYDSTASGTYALSAGDLAAGSETVGSSGSGTFSQTGGTHSAGNVLSLGALSGASGTYDLSAGDLAVGFEDVGNYGTGAFTQTGGTNTVTSGLVLGYESTGSGSYALSGSGSLAADREYVGNYGTGAFTQSGGTNTVDFSLYLGSNSTGSGSYDLSGTGSLAAGLEYVGYSGTGVFTQRGGTNTVATTLTLAKNAGATGTYHLAGGQLTAATVQVNSGGTFDFTGGRLSVGTFNGDLTNQGGTLAPGASPGATTISGDYTVSDPAAVLEIELGGLLTSEYDHVAVSGTANLGGLLEVLLWGGFTPSAGDSFDLLTATTISGTFDSLAFPVLGGGLAFNLAYLLDPNGIDIARLTVEAVPEPASMALVGSALLGVIGLARRRRG